MHQGFVVAIFIAARELQIAVDIQPRVIFPLRNQKALIRGGLRMNDFIAVECFFTPTGEVLGAKHGAH